MAILSIGYFLAFSFSLLKALRYYLDYKRSGQKFMLIGVPANFALAATAALLIIATGEDPAIPQEVRVVAIRLSFMAWAILSALFEAVYVSTWLTVSQKENHEHS